jgi:hypothetical protein
VGSIPALVNKPHNKFFFQLRDSVHNFFGKELAPFADQIDKENGFPQMRVKSLYVSIQMTAGCLPQVINHP